MLLLSDTGSTLVICGGFKCKLSQPLARSRFPSTGRREGTRTPISLVLRSNATMRHAAEICGWDTRTSCPTRVYKKPLSTCLLECRYNGLTLVYHSFCANETNRLQKKTKKNNVIVNACVTFARSERVNYGRDLIN